MQIQKQRHVEAGCLSVCNVVLRSRAGSHVLAAALVLTDATIPLLDHEYNISYGSSSSYTFSTVLNKIPLLYIVS
jgi:hypothetical protein